MSLWRSGEQRWCSCSWLADQKVWCSIYGVAATISEICYFLLPSAMFRKRRNQPAWRSSDVYFHLYIYIYNFLNTPCFYYKITQFRMMIRRLKRGRALRSGECNVGMLQKTAIVFPRVWLTADGHTLSSEWLCHDTLEMNIDECDNKIQTKTFIKTFISTDMCEWV